MEFEEKTLKSEKIFDGVLLHLVREEVLLPNGKTSVREMIRHPGAVAMIPFTSDGKMVMVRQFRKPLDRTVVEIPAGKLETSDAEPLLAAIRELEEETDYRAEKWSELTVFYPTPAYLDEIESRHNVPFGVVNTVYNSLTKIDTTGLVFCSDNDYKGYSTFSPEGSLDQTKIITLAPKDIAALEDYRPTFRANQLKYYGISEANKDYNFEVTVSAFVISSFKVIEESLKRI
jgi:ADP-ribose pyrophosphatase YjhB (NUDIX family)